jgi:hypothetical protein
MKVRSVDDLLEPSDDNCFNTATISISRDEVLALYDRQYKKLSKKSKDELIKMLIGEKPYFV